MLHATRRPMRQDALQAAPFLFDLGIALNMKGSDHTAINAGPKMLCDCQGNKVLPSALFLCSAANGRPWTSLVSITAVFSECQSMPTTTCACPNMCGYGSNGADVSTRWMTVTDALH
jgi:hypothetical protein